MFSSANEVVSDAKITFLTVVQCVLLMQSAARRARMAVRIATETFIFMTA